jgi:hypothetical protein
MNWINLDDSMNEHKLIINLLHYRKYIIYILLTLINPHNVLSIKRIIPYKITYYIIRVIKNQL